MVAIWLGQVPRLVCRPVYGKEHQLVGEPVLRRAPRISPAWYADYEAGGRGGSRGRWASSFGSRSTLSCERLAQVGVAAS